MFFDIPKSVSFGVSLCICWNTYHKGKGEEVEGMEGKVGRERREGKGRREERRSEVSRDVEEK